MPGVVAEALREPRHELVPRLGAGDDDRALEAGDVPRLARARERQPVLRRRAAERDVRRVRRARERERRVDLVGEDEHAVTRRERGDGVELLAAEYAADRVVRVAEQVRGRAACERPLECVEVELPARPGCEWRLDDAPACLARSHPKNGWYTGGLTTTRRPVSVSALEQTRPHPTSRRGAA